MTLKLIAFFSIYLKIGEGTKLELDSLEDVAQKSGINIYRVKLLDSFVIKVGYETIKKLIKSLAQLDVDIKKGLIDENLGIKTFMLTLLA